MARERELLPTAERREYSNDRRRPAAGANSTVAGLLPMVEAEDDVVGRVQNDCNEATDNGQKDEDGVSRFGQTSRSLNAPEDVDKK